MKLEKSILVLAGSILAGSVVLSGGLYLAAGEIRVSSYAEVPDRITLDFSRSAELEVVLGGLLKTELSTSEDMGKLPVELSTQGRGISVSTDLSTSGNGIHVWQ